MNLIIILMLFTLMYQSAEKDELKVITFNIRYGEADDGENSWPYRKNVLFEFVGKEQADFLGLQEAMIFQVEEIISENPEYSYTGRTRLADGTSGEATPILYKEKDYELLEHGTRWLSETPEIPASKSWDTSLPRIFTWAVFRRKSDGKEIVIYNTHFDHLGKTARFESSGVILSHMEQHFPQENVILLGDFNAEEGTKPIDRLSGRLKDTYRLLNDQKKEKDMTFYGWNDHLPGTGKRIDYIFHKGDLEPAKAYVSDFHKGERYPSDHMPVVAVFKY